MPLPQGMHNTAQAVRTAAELVQWAWVQLAEGSSLSAGEQRAYIGGLTTPRSIEHPVGGDPYQARVVNLATAAPRLEHGFAAYHLPERINWAQARGARRSKAGRYYMIIPFTHGAYRGHKGPARTQARAMPPSVYRAARRLLPGMHLTSGRSYGMALHAPGMTPYIPAFRRNRRVDYEHALRQERMIRRPGRGSGSVYLTFRTIHESSVGWWIPGRQGVELAKQAQRDTAPAVQAMLTAAVRQDVEDLMRQQLGGR